MALRLVLDLGIYARRRVDSKYSHSMQLRSLSDHEDQKYADVHDDVDRLEIRKVNGKDSSAQGFKIRAKEIFSAATYMMVGIMMRNFLFQVHGTPASICSYRVSPEYSIYGS